MNGFDFLDLAVRLSASHKEADLRSAVSRAYYGVYHLAIAFVEDAGVALPAAAEAHEKLVWLLNAGETLRAIDASRMLASLRKERNRADYDLSVTKYRESPNVRTQLIAAQEIVAALAACGVEPVRSEVHANIRSFARNTLRLIVADDI